MNLMKASQQAIAAARAARAEIRAGFDKPTAGMAPGMTQANMICLPRDWAFDFLLYVQRNPQSCPVLDVSDAVMISGRFPAVHGAPVHIGEPHLPGINDMNTPDFGDAVRIEADEIPVFWACGVTPQAAVMRSGVPFAISHAPGHMFITDVPDAAWQGV